MKKIAAFLTAATLILSLAACGTPPAAPSVSATPTPETTPGASHQQEEKRTIKIGVSMSVMDEGMTRLYGFMEERAKSLTDYNVEIFYTNAEGTVDKQLSDIDSLIAKSPDIIYVMCVDSDGVVPGIKAIKDAGIMAAAGRAINTDLLDFLYIGFDQYSIGQTQADWLQAKLDADPAGKFNVGYIEGTAGQSSAAERENGFIENFITPNAGAENVSLVASADGNYKTDTAQGIVEDWLIAYPEMNVIVCCNDEMAMGAVNAAKSAQRDDIIVLGADGTEAGIKLVADGDMAMTVSINIPLVGGGAVDKCVETVVNGKAENSIINMGTQNLTVTD